ncbi:MAG: hypothetical protein HY210_00120 [Candidatus Omnitrophica bacterium]|nr:hypothetical protein [Candidatus Omnitrophota bacterium]
MTLTCIGLQGMIVVAGRRTCPPGIRVRWRMAVSCAGMPGGRGGSLQATTQNRPEEYGEDKKGSECFFIPDFSIEKSASSDSERPQGQTRREFVLLLRVHSPSLD